MPDNNQSPAMSTHPDAEGFSTASGAPDEHTRPGDATGGLLNENEKYIDLIDWLVLGNVIRQLRNKRRMTQVGLSEASSLDNTYISQIENGRKPNVSIAAIAGLAKALGVFPEFLLLIVMHTSPREGRAARMYKKLRKQIIDDLKIDLDY